MKKHLINSKSEDNPTLQFPVSMDLAEGGKVLDWVTGDFLRDLVIFLQVKGVLSQSTSLYIISGSGLSQRGGKVK